MKLYLGVGEAIKITVWNDGGKSSHYLASANYSYGTFLRKIILILCRTSKNNCCPLI